MAYLFLICVLVFDLALIIKLGQFCFLCRDNK